MNVSFFLATCLLPAGLPAQHRPAPQVPDAATAAFRRTYPAATRATWEPQAGNYAVRFTQQKLVRKAVFTPEGALVERHEEVAYSALPPQARTLIAQRFPHRQLDKIYRVTPAAGTPRYAVLVCAGKDKRGHDRDCQTTLFDQDGRLLTR